MLRKHESAGRHRLEPMHLPSWTAWAVESLAIPIAVPLATLVAAVAEKLWLDSILVVFIIYVVWTVVCPVLLYVSAQRRASAIQAEDREAKVGRSLDDYTRTAGYSLAFFGLFIFISPAVGDLFGGDAPRGMRWHNVIIVLGVVLVYAVLSALSYRHLRNAVRAINERRRRFPGAGDQRFA